MRKWLKELRQKQGFTQEETAHFANISRSYYTHIEQGNKTPTVAVAKKIAHTLEFNWVLFFENEEDAEE